MAYAHKIWQPLALARGAIGTESSLRLGAAPIGDETYADDGARTYSPQCVDMTMDRSVVA